MGGGLFVEELPYFYAHHRHPVSQRWIPVYDSSFPAHHRNELAYYYDDSLYDAYDSCDSYGDSVPMLLMEVPFRGDSNLARKRKLDGLKRETISAGGRNVRDSLVEETGGKASSSSLVSKPMQSPKVSSSLVSHMLDAPESNISTVQSDEKVSSVPRVVSIPVTSNDGVRDNIEDLIPKEGGKKSSTNQLSAGLAACVIQSWFRGHLVRRTDALTHLRTITGVRSQLMELEDKLSDDDFIEYVRENPSGQMKLMEKIMKLLLQLDAIQGAHPVVREVRKATTKRVVSLQERADDLLYGKTVVVDSSHTSMEIEEHLPMNEAEHGHPVKVHPDQPSTFGSESSGNSHYEGGEIQGSKQVDEGVGLPRFVPIPESVEETSEDVSMDTTAARDTNQAQTCQIEADVNLEEDSSRQDMEDLIDNYNNIHSGNVPKVVQTDGSNDEDTGRVRRHKDVARDMTHDEMNEEPTVVACDTFGTEHGDEVAHPLAKQLNSSRKELLLPGSPRYPTVLAEDCVDPPSISENYHSKGEIVPENHLDATAFRKEDNTSDNNEVLQLLKLSQDMQSLKSMQELSEENEALKSILIGVLKWNQLQGNAMKDVNHRLGDLERRLLTRSGKKSSKRSGKKISKHGPRRLGKSARMYL